jgi:diamine N-acetyltransferase
MPAFTLRMINRRRTSDIDRLQAVLEGAPGYSLAVEGKLPTLNAAIEVLDALPPDKGHSDKFVYEISHDAEAVGRLDMVRGYPETDIAFIGLLLLREGSQGRGFGPQVLRLAEAIGMGWQCRALRIAVIDSNPRAFNFWKSEGFIELLRKPAMDFAGQAIVMERAFPTAAIGSGQSVLRFAFSDLRARRIQALVDELNEKSWRLSERVGMRFEGTQHHFRIEPSATSKYEGLRIHSIMKKIRLNFCTEWPLCIPATDRCESRAADH